MATMLEIIQFENVYANSLNMLDGAGWTDRFRCPEGAALLAHYEGLLRTAHARGRKTKEYSGMQELEDEIREAIVAWDVRGELRPAGDPDFEALLKFHREA